MQVTLERKSNPSCSRKWVRAASNRSASTCKVPGTEPSATGKVCVVEGLIRGTAMADQEQRVYGGRVSPRA